MIALISVSRPITTCFLILASIILQGCSSQIPQNFAFKPESSKGVVIASIPERGWAIQVSVQKYDPETNIRSKAFSVAGSFSSYNPFGADTQKFVAISLEPGHYYISQTSVSSGGTKRVRPLLKSVMAFKVNPQETIYLGDFSVTNRGRVSHTGYSDALTKSFLDTFPNLPNDFIRADLSIQSIRLPK